MERNRFLYDIDHGYLPGRAGGFFSGTCTASHPRAPFIAAAGAPPPRPGRDMIRPLAAAITRFRPETVALAVFFVVLAVLRLVYGDTFTADKLTAKVPAVAMALIAAAACTDRSPLWRRWFARGVDGPRPDALRTILDWLPAILCILVYENLHDLVRLMHAETFDRQLAAVDAWIFGVQPTLWLQRFTTPWLTDLLSIAYASYFLTPAILGGLLYASGRIAEFRTFMLVVIVSLYLGFLGYVLVPAVGPIHFLGDQYDAPARLSGIFFHRGAEELMNAWRPIHRDCFPSLHTAVSTLTSLWAWRTRRLHRFGFQVAAVYLPLNAALWFATVYLRYHWVIDLAAGWLLAAAVAWAIPPIARRWYALHEAGLRQGGADA